MKKIYMAFTLAEVLLVLAIIGIVSAITIPSIMQKTNDQELKTAWKNSFAELSQTTRLLTDDYGGDLTNAFSGDGYTGNEKLADAYAEKLKYVKFCHAAPSNGGTGGGATIDGCWEYSDQFYYLNGQPENASHLTRMNPAVILSNGTSVLFSFDPTDANCGSLKIGVNGSYKMCGQLWVDVNGLKQPNTIGKDIFIANIESNGILLPLGNHPEKTCVVGSTDALNSGSGCSAKYLYAN